MDLEKSSSKINDELIEVFQQCSGGRRPDAAMKHSCGASQIFMGFIWFVCTNNSSFSTFPDSWLSMWFGFGLEVLENVFKTGAGE